MEKRKDEKLNARQKYDKNNPTICIRVTAEQKERLSAMAEKDGVSISTYVKNFLDNVIIRDEDMENAIAGAYAKGRMEGYSEAREKYSIELPCYLCGGSIDLTPDGAIHKNIIRTRKFRHLKCP